MDQVDNVREISLPAFADDLCFFTLGDVACELAGLRNDGASGAAAAAPSAAVDCGVATDGLMGCSFALAVDDEPAGRLWHDIVSMRHAPNVEEKLRALM
jgi:hypothetical protein